MAEEKKLLLDLSTSNSIGYVTIEHDGTILPYDLIKTNNLSILQRQKLGTLGVKLSGAIKIKTVKDEDRYNDILLDILCLIIPSASRSILSKLPVFEKVEAVTVYMEECGMLKKKVTPLQPGKRAKKKRRR